MSGYLSPRFFYEKMEGGIEQEMKVVRYSTEQRDWVIEQMVSPLSRSVVELAKATGITPITLRTWQQAARAEGEECARNWRQDATLVQCREVSDGA